jgi:hypothetical protein
MVRIRRVSAALDNCLRPLERHVHWHHCTYGCVLVVTSALRRGRRRGAHVYRSRKAPSHRPRVNTLVLVERWEPAVVLRQPAQEGLRALHPQPGETIALIIDDAKHATRGPCMDKAELRQLGVQRIDTSIHLKNELAHRFYERHGFRPLSEGRLACVL